MKNLFFYLFLISYILILGFTFNNMREVGIFKLKNRSELFYKKICIGIQQTTKFKNVQKKILLRK